MFSIRFNALAIVVRRLSDSGPMRVKLCGAWRKASTMRNWIEKHHKTWVKAGLAALAALGLSAAPAAAQGLETFDPDEAYAIDGAAQAAGASVNNAVNTAASTASDAVASASSGIDADLVGPSVVQPTEPVRVPDTTGPATVETGSNPGFADEFSQYSDYGTAPVAPAQQSEWGIDSYADAASATGDGSIPGAPDNVPTADSNTYAKDDLLGAAEGVFGKGAKGLAGLIEDLLSKQGEPNAYIVGREGGGAFILGARYGSGTLHHKIEGERKVYWTGPSIGFDAGANAGSTFTLVYNLYDSQDIFKRYPGGEGQAYFVGGLHVSYMRRGDVVLIPIRVGAGLRLGVNAGYLKFSEKQRWLPF